MRANETVRQVTTRLCAAFVMLGLSAAGALAGQAYVFDKAHTVIRFSWNHLGFTEQSARFTAFDGRLVFDEKEPSKSAISVTIRADSVLSGIDGMDKALKGPDYFDVAKHPDIRFESTRIRRTGAKTGEMTGNLTIKGITRPVTLAVTFRFAGPHPLGPLIAKYKGVRVAAFSARGRVLRSDFGMGKYVPLVSDEIAISIETEWFAEK